MKAACTREERPAHALIASNYPLQDPRHDCLQPPDGNCAAEAKNHKSFICLIAFALLPDDD